MNYYGDELPTDEFVFAACDGIYFRQHASAFARSVSAIGMHSHIHVISPTPEDFTLAYMLKGDIDNRLTVTYSDTIVDDPNIARMYYSVVRFLFVPLMLQRGARKIMVTDIDCIFNHSWTWPAEDAGLFFRESLPGTIGWEKEGTKVAAGAVYLTPKALPFSKLVADMIQDGTKAWFADQVALHRAYMKCRDHISFATITNHFMDWEFNDGSIMWTGKGNRKDKDAKYLARKKELDDVHDGAVERFWK